MKTLINIRTKEQLDNFSVLTEQDDFLLFHQEESLSELEKLQQAAKFADTASCDLLVDIQENVKPEQISVLLNALEDNDIPSEVLVADSGQEPKGSEARALLMLQLLTGEKICGFRNKFRLYPVKLLTHAPEYFFVDEMFFTRILIQGSRDGYKISNVKLSDYTENEQLPVPRKQYFSLELLKALRPWPTKRLCPRNFRKEKFKEFLFHPIKFLKFLLIENASPGGLAAAAATGMFLGTLPLLGCHTAAIIYVSIKLRLNKMLSVNISHLCMPPFVPIACIEIGYYLRHGKLLATPSFQNMVEELPQRIVDWIIGSLILAPINAIVFALITYIIVANLRSALQKRKTYVEKSK